MTRGMQAAHMMAVMTMFDQLDVAGCPFEPMKVPPLTAHTIGPWELAQPQYNVLARGYFSGLQVLSENWVLRNRKQRKVWMSVAPMELESQAHHVLAAHGRVLIGGGGMGVVAWNCAQKPEVKEIVILERDTRIIDLLWHLADMGQWENWNKVTILQADVLEYAATPGLFDVALIDIWPGLGDTLIRPNMKIIHKNVQAKRYAAWGMELDFVTWLQQGGYHVAAANDPERWNAYGEAVGIPWIMENEPKMGQYAVQAALQYIKLTGAR